MDKKITHMFNTSPCPSQEELLNYISGKMTAAEQRKVEAHMVDCEMCSDELDGLMNMKHPEQIGEISKLINIEIDNKLEQAQKKRFLNNNIILAMAAILLVLVVVTFIFNKQQIHQSDSLEVAELTPEEQEVSVAEESVELTDQEKQSIVPQEFPASEDMRNENNTTRTISEESGDFEDQSKLAEDADDAVGFWDGEGLKNDSPFETDIVEEQQDESAIADVVYATTTTGNSEYDKKASGGVVTGDSSTRTKDKHEQSKAAKTTQSPATAESTSITTSDRGQQLFEQGDYSGSLKFYSKELSNNPANQKAQWYTALCLIKLGRVDEGILILEAIISAEGIYLDAAKEELKKQKGE